VRLDISQQESSYPTCGAAAVDVPKDGNSLSNDGGEHEVVVVAIVSCIKNDDVVVSVLRAKLSKLCILSRRLLLMAVEAEEEEGYDELMTSRLLAVVKGLGKSGKGFLKVTEDDADFPEDTDDEEDETRLVDTLVTLTTDRWGGRLLSSSSEIMGYN
jgi:hypothetical protein